MALKPITAMKIIRICYKTQAQNWLREALLGGKLFELARSFFEKLKVQGNRTEWICTNISNTGIGMIFLQVSKNASMQPNPKFVRTNFDPLCMEWRIGFFNAVIFVLLGKQFQFITAVEYFAHCMVRLIQRRKSSPIDSYCKKKKKRKTTTNVCFFSLIFYFFFILNWPLKFCIRKKYCESKQQNGKTKFLYSKCFNTKVNNVCKMCARSQQTFVIKSIYCARMDSNANVSALIMCGREDSRFN